jgi:hypothetical protein
MRSSVWLAAWVLTGSLACRSVSYVDDGGGGATSSSSSTGSSTDCTDGCDDLNPCTDDACVAGSCQHTPRDEPESLDDNPCTVDACNESGELLRPFVTAGEPGRALEGGCPDAALCQTDGACGLSLYTRPFPIDDPAVLWTRTALSLAWNGTNAPPPRGIVAAEHSYAIDRLYVVDEVGTGYLRSDGVWAGSAPIETIFPGLPPTEVASLIAWLPQTDADETSVFYTRGSPRRAHFFDVAESGAVVGVGPVEDLVDDPANPQVPPQGSVDASWAFAHQTAFIGTPSWVVFPAGFAADVFLLDGGDFTWLALGPDVDTTLWGGSTTGGPAPGSVVAAYLEGGSLYAVAP